MEKKILIAHQNTIPHYRVQFYNKIKHYKPDWWDFTVVFDPQESEKNFHVPVDTNNFNFNFIERKNYSIRLKNSSYSVQNFVSDGLNSDLIIVEHAINNIAYPLSFLFKLFNKKYALWGTGHDFAYPNPKGIKYLIEKIKLFLAKNCDGFFAYTNSVKEYLSGKGCAGNNIFVLNNTIDINKQKDIYEGLKEKREKLKKDKGVEKEYIITYVGRFNKYKNSNFLFNTCIELSKLSGKCKFFFAGGGGDDFIANLAGHIDKGRIEYLGVISDEELSELFTISDVYLFPGSVGLGPLQGLCYDLIPVVIDSPYQNSEFDYLSEKNSVILNPGVSTHEYARAVLNLLDDAEKLSLLKKNAWDSIKHLTLDNMANNFVRGIEKIFSD